MLNSIPGKQFSVFIVLFLSASCFADFRCGNKLARIGDDFSAVLDVCGEPYATYQLGTRYITVNQTSQQNYQSELVADAAEVTEAIQTEMWVYKPGQGKLKRILYFENGILVRVTYGERS